jgi:hypothetical protein
MNGSPSPDIPGEDVMGENRFERPGCPPHPDDPLTTESVRTALSRLVDQLAAGEA